MDFSIKIDPRTWQKYIAVQQKGKTLLFNPFINKGTAFTVRERDELNLHGLLPPCVCTIEEQLDRTYENFQSKPNDLEKFIYLTNLRDRNETLFFRLAYKHIDEMMPIIYTPTVGEACQKFSHIWQRGRGLYINYNQMQNIENILANSYIKDPSVIVVTDGERILGLGDQGAGGMGISIGKLCVYTLCAGVSPYTTLPITLDAGTDNKERLNDPLYIGIRQERVRGEEYQAFIDRFIDAVCKVFPNVLLQWEDLLKANAIKQLNRFKDTLCSFNDDIQGTSGIVLAIIYGALHITRQQLRDARLLIAGAGAAAHGIADLTVSALQEEGLSIEEAQKHIWTVDTKGLVTKARSNLEEFKATYARDVAEIATYKCKDRSKITLEEAIANAKPTILIGTSATPGIFNQAVVKAMAEINDHPIILPLSNPTSKSECTPEEAIRWSEGRAIVCTGSPFPPVEYDGRVYQIGQCNNAFIFPGVGLGVMVGSIRRVTNGMFLQAAKVLSQKLTDGDLKECTVYPDFQRIRECSHAVACAVIKYAVSEGNANEEVLVNLEENIERAMWSPEYMPIRYEALDRDDTFK